MKQIKLAIIYYSMTGHNYEMALWAKDAAEAAGAEVRLLKVAETLDTAGAESNPAWKAYLERSAEVPEATGDDLIWADAILFSSPTRFGNVASQFKAFMDAQGGLWAEGKLGTKVVSAMATAGNNNGGQELTIQAIYHTVMHWGAIIVPTGYTDDSIYVAGGNPYGTSGTATHEGFGNDLEGAVRHQAKRLVDVTQRFVD